MRIAVTYRHLPSLTVTRWWYPLFALALIVVEAGAIIVFDFYIYDLHAPAARTFHEVMMGAECTIPCHVE